ncbi:hypothetical protein DAPPUDRAFT_269477 [Daphnia pulex]|uniref:HAT C-terminal dimerisation domain-containing protein n=1 Tax=Daphnia pulex TaxID=6669 RepID=E9HZC8_DAPPU|nr:hypothetical protein DAPPUDRAFT_269477 [Daphnia pulex]|eukprot:EFX62902.1 hypothetical protein DAPPUDRAFT_269477 [Daphnia pulex]
MAARNPPDAAQTHDVAVTEPATAKEASVPASTSTQSVQHTEVMGTHIELDTSRDDSNLSSSSPSRDRENDTRNPEDATSVQSLKESEDIKRLSYPPSFFKFIEPSAKNGNSLYAFQVKDCPRMGKTLSAINNSRGNLRAHIKTAHKGKLEEFNTLCKEIDAIKVKGVKPLSLRDHSDKKNETDRKPAFVQQVLSFQGKQSYSAADGIQSEDSDYSPQRKKTKKDFFKSILTTTVPAESNEVDLFLADQSSKMSSLNKYPTIKAIFIKYNAAFPSSASVERLFSVAGRIFTPLRGPIRVTANDHRNRGSLSDYRGSNVPRSLSDYRGSNVPR